MATSLCAWNVKRYIDNVALCLGTEKRGWRGKGHYEKAPSPSFFQWDYYSNRYAYPVSDSILVLLKSNRMLWKSTVAKFFFIGIIKAIGMTILSLILFSYFSSPTLIAQAHRLGYLFESINTSIVIASWINSFGIKFLCKVAIFFCGETLLKFLLFVRL